DIFMVFDTAAAYLAPSAPLAFSFLALGAVICGILGAPLFSTIQTLVPPRMRAMAIALLFTAANLIGFGLGPLIAGALSDALRSRFGDESLRYSLLLLTPGYFWAAWHVWRASKTVQHDIDSVQDLDRRSAEALSAATP